MFSRARKTGLRCLTVLEEDGKAFLDEQVGIENDQSKGERKNVVTGADLEEIPDCFL